MNKTAEQNIQNKYVGQTFEELKDGFGIKEIIYNDSAEDDSSFDREYSLVIEYDDNGTITKIDQFLGVEFRPDKEGKMQEFPCDIDYEALEDMMCEEIGLA